MRQVFAGIMVLTLVSGCAGVKLGPLFGPKPAPEPAPVEAEAEPPEIAPVPTAARTVEQFDTTTPEQRAAAAAGNGTREVNLGMTIATLGAASEPGFWLKTPLVSTPAKGRVFYPRNGRSVQVDLIPIEGPKTAGSRMSLGALRLIDAPLTGLPEVRVYQAN